MLISWILQIAFRILVEVPVKAQIAQAQGDMLYDGVGGNVATLFTGWLLPLLACLLIVMPINAKTPKQPPLPKPTSKLSKFTMWVTIGILLLIWSLWTLGFELPESKGPANNWQQTFGLQGAIGRAIYSYKDTTDGDYSVSEFALSDEARYKFAMQGHIPANPEIGTTWQNRAILPTSKASK